MAAEFQPEKIYTKPIIHVETRKMCPTCKVLFSLRGLPIHQLVWEEPDEPGVVIHAIKCTVELSLSFAGSG